MICRFEGAGSLPILAPRLCLATRMAVGLQHCMQFDQCVRIVLAPSTGIADHCCEIRNADDMAILHREIRDPLGDQVAHLAFGAGIVGSTRLGLVLFAIWHFFQLQGDWLSLVKRIRYLWAVATAPALAFFSSDAATRCCREPILHTGVRSKLH